MLHYTINPESEVPVYRQLVDQINAEIRSGALKTGTQLPTVREMAERMNLSCGTVKRVYDRLREMGDIEMTRRRGTFVKYVRVDRDSRKIQAMTAIDRMIRQLSDLNFSPAEIQIFLNLKMREWGLKWSGIRIALVTDCTELASAYENQLSRIGNVHVIICSVRQLLEYPYNIDEESDVILASQADGQRLSAVLPDKSKLICVAFRAGEGGISALAASGKKKLGLLCESDAFRELVEARLSARQRAELRVFSGREMPQPVDMLVVPPDWERLCTPDTAESYAACKKTVFDYGIDEGSMIYLEERINRIRDERQLQPGAFGF